MGVKRLLFEAIYIYISYLFDDNGFIDIEDNNIQSTWCPWTWERCCRWSK